MKLAVPDPSLVLLIGPSGAGKSTFAQSHFSATQVLSSDSLRASLADDPDDQDASAEAFQVLGLLLRGRLVRRLLTVVDATNLRGSSRVAWVRLAGRNGLPAVAIGFDLPVAAYLELNRLRPGRQVDESVVWRQAERMAAAMAALPDEGYVAVHVLRSLAEMASAEVVFMGQASAT